MMNLDKLIQWREQAPEGATRDIKQSARSVGDEIVLEVTLRHTGPPRKFDFTWQHVCGPGEAVSPAMAAFVDRVLVEFEAAMKAPPGPGESGGHTLR
jgi:hypothetical protein